MNTLRYAVLPLFLGFIAVSLLAWGLTIVATIVILHVRWLAYSYGYRPGDGNSPHYLFYSGYGSIILPPILTVSGIAVLAMWHHQCGVHGCYWYAPRTTAAGDRACWKHHPHPHLSIEDIRARHHLYMGKKIGDG